MAFSVYTEQSWTDGSGGGTPVSAARLSHLEDGAFNAHYMPAVRVFHNANQSLTTSTNTTLAFNSERFDTAGNGADTMHDTATNNSRLTVKYAGKYQISATVEFAANSTGNRAIWLQVNGTTIIAREFQAAIATNAACLAISTLYDMAVNDYVEVIAFQSSGGALNVTTNANFSPEFMMVRVA